MKLVCDFLAQLGYIMANISKTIHKGAVINHGEGGGQLNGRGRANEVLPLQKRGGDT